MIESSKTAFDNTAGQQCSSSTKVRATNSLRRTLSFRIFTEMKALGLVLAWACLSASLAAADTPDAFRPPTPPPNGGEVAPDLSRAEFEHLSKSDPGAIAFFNEFDADDNHVLSQTEFTKLVQASMERGYMQPGFDIVGAWSNLVKNARGQLTLRDFLHFTAKVQGNAPSSIQDQNKAGAGVMTFQQQKTFAHCEEMFDAYDKDRSGTLSLAEFKLAVNGKMTTEQFYALPRSGGDVLLRVWVNICSNLFGLPKGPDTEKFQADAGMRSPLCSQCLFSFWLLVQQ